MSHQEETDTGWSGFDKSPNPDPPKKSAKKNQIYTRGAVRHSQNLFFGGKFKAFTALLACILARQTLSACTIQGTYDDGGGGCDICPAGSSCNISGSTLVSSTPCNNGEYSLAGEITCKTCPAGYECPSPSSTPALCDATNGKFSSAGVQSCSTKSQNINTYTSESTCGLTNNEYFRNDLAYRCHKCPLGSACDASTKLKTDCTPGQYSNDNSGYGSTSCQDCPTSKYCPSRTASVGENCLAGTYTSSQNQVACQNCPADQTCSGGSITGSCSTGQYSPGSAASCLNCPAGFSCSGGSRTPCAAGEYSANGAATCTQCSPGSFCADPTSTTETPCPSGTHSGAGAVRCVKCKAGFECAGGIQNACPSNTYSLEGQDNCTPIVDGQHFNTAVKDAVPQNCQLSYYSDSGTSNQCTQCPDGHKCPTITAKVACAGGEVCFAGTSSGVPGSCPDYKDCVNFSAICTDGQYWNGSSCQQCPKDQTCILRGTPQAVTSAYYSPTGVNIEFLCPGGYDCSDADNVVECADGYFREEGTSTLTCTKCPDTHGCPNKQLGLNNQIECANVRGYYQEAGASGEGTMACKVCEPGYMCPYGDTRRTACSAGYWSLGAAEFCHICPAGYECPFTTKPAMNPCLTGTHSNAGQAACTVCDEGFECVGEHKIACAANKWASRGDGICKFFAAGIKQLTSYSGAGVASFTQCDVGQYSLFGTLHCVDCPVGHYCPSPEFQPKVCKPGEYQPNTKQTSCLTCSSGTFSLFGHTYCHDCPQAQDCTGGVDKLPKKCDTGFYSANAAVGCLPCQDGLVCNYLRTGGTHNSSNCPKELICKITASDGLIQEVCSGGTRGNAMAQTDTSQCVDCQAGYFCPPGNSEEWLCPIGFYCPLKSERPVPCAAGTYNPTYGKQASGDCQPCPQGYYCPLGAGVPVQCPSGYTCGASTTDGLAAGCPAGKYSGNDLMNSAADCQTCWKGHYCEINSVFPTPCPVGQYNTNTGSQSSADCVDISAGLYSPYTGNQHGDSVAIPCVPGYYCPAATKYAYEYPCPAGKFSDKNGLTQASDCQDCPEGFACSAGTNSLTNPMQPCAQGHFCPLNTPTPTTNTCTAGFYSSRTDLKLQTECTKCPAGKYCLGDKAAPDGDCDAGSYCPEGSTTSAGTLCPPGTYISTTGAQSLTECIACPLGNYCTGGAVVPQQCPIGTFGPFSGLDSDGVTLPATGTRPCHTCPGGYLCANLGTITPVACGVGFYSDNADTACHICTAGYYCDLKATDKTDMENNRGCPTGFICPAGTNEYPYLDSIGLTTTLPNQYSCAPGNFCILSASVACAPGTYQPLFGASSAAACLQTPAGHYSIAAGTAEFYDLQCPQGFYCPAGTSNPRVKANICPKGYFRRTLMAKAQSDCAVCPSGFFCPEQTMEPLICPKGYFCAVGVEIPKPCPIGTFGSSEGLTQKSDCTPCFGGRYCSQYGLIEPDGLCDSGYYCVDKSMTPVPTVLFVGSIGNRCEAGGYCPVASKYPAPCFPGFYNPNVRKTSPNDCLACAPGQFCDGRPDAARTDLHSTMDYLKTILPSPSMSGPCDPGYYCTGQAATARQNYATAGHYTLSGASQEEQCPITTYQSKIAQSTCDDCPTRYYCDTLALTYPKLCPQGKYCGFKISVPSLCSTGTYSDLTHLETNAECQACKSGQYCATQGLTSPTGDCLPGYFCFQSATRNDPPSLVANFGPCPRYHYCESKSGKGSVCKPGTHSTNTQRTAESQCTAQTTGQFAHTVAGTDASPTMVTGNCAEGYYCNEVTGASWPTRNDKGCQESEKCVEGSVNPVACPAGTFQLNKLQGDCLQCPAGYYCEAPTNLITTITFKSKKCPKGHWCPAGTTSSTANPCPKGTFQPNLGAKEKKECIPAPPGFYIDTTATEAFDPLKTCSAGYYCKLGSTTATPATPNALAGDEIYDNYGKRCDAGFYCPAGAPIMIPCTPGKRCSSAGLSSPSSNCPAGKYCEAGTSNNQQNCPAGYYCPIQSAAPTPCPAGTYQPSQNQDAVGDCQNVPVGSYSSDIARTTLTGAPTCEAGFTCPAGSTHGRVDICPVGYKCPFGSSVKIQCIQPEYQDEVGATTCKTCPAGFECTVSTAVRCEPNLPTEGLNFYCPIGQWARISCPNGKYTMQDAASLLSDCLTCPPGYYCPNNAADRAGKIVECPAGKFCFEGLHDVSSSIYDCPAGFYCPLGSNAPLPCQVGQYCATTGLALPTAKCNGGYYCDLVQTSRTTLGNTIAYCTSTGGGSNCGRKFCMNNNPATCFIGRTTATPAGNECPQGHFCQSGSYKPTPCPIGTYLDLTGKTLISDCKDCPPGYFCPSAGMTSYDVNANKCEFGYYCTNKEGNIFANPCQAGFYCPAGAADQIPCAAGTYNPNKIRLSCEPCPQGYYCPDTGMLTPFICPAGQYCGPSTITPQNCPEGRFSDLQGLINSTKCQVGSFGKQYAGTGLTSPSAGTNCDALKKCYPTSSNPITAATQANCVNGEICPGGVAVPQLCPPGTYGSVGASAIYNCQNCDVDKYCPLWGMTAATQLTCPDGYLCLGGAIHPSNRDDVTVRLCPKGSYCAMTSTGNRETPCAIGYFNPREGQTACEACPAGFSCPITGMVNPEACPRGSYCIKNVVAGQPSQTIPCPAGTFNSNLYGRAISDCQPCPPGRYCELGSATFTGLCDRGYVCTGGQAIAAPTGTFDFLDYLPAKSGPCPKGHYCPIGSSFPVPCKAGTFQNLAGQYECKACPATSYCGTIGLIAPSGTCEEGYVCFGSAIYAKPNDYITGRLCSKGHFCTSGAEFKCTDGSYSSVEGLAKCETCPPGWACFDADGTIDPIICPTKHYCPAGTGQPNICPAGTYTQVYQNGLEDQNQCSDCPTGFYCENGEYNRAKVCEAGFYCLSGAALPNDPNRLCPSGYYCSEGTKLPTSCEAGKYSAAGAKSDDDCVECIAGYYCVIGVNTAYLYDCPIGHYCPAGEFQPKKCPKGTYNEREKQTSLKACRKCPKGTSCDEEGIGDYTSHLCDPGYYCPEDSYLQRPCEPGTYRPTQGAHDKGPIVYERGIVTAGCYYCPRGYFCNKQATVIPELCPVGQYCAQGSTFPTDCRPGYYCKAGSGSEVPCPAGFYCLGRSEERYKCPFAHYCPPASPAPIRCPNGTFGSGVVDNVSVEKACRPCGRGLYSIQGSDNKCLDCEPGYVCLGQTSEKYPTDWKKDNGFKCPQGHFCPSGSYEPKPCPVGYYAKYEGTTSVDKCLKCKVNWYNDLTGQGGCKRCGPTAYTFEDGAATTCQCIGKYRAFVRSLGSCLCKRGFKPKDGALNIDSKEDCEADVVPVCEPDQKIDQYGNCITAGQERALCDIQCPFSGGSVVDGTGLCTCERINDISEVCDEKCKTTLPVVKMTNEGILKIYDPVQDVEGQIDPSTLPGWYGEFKMKQEMARDDTTAVFLGTEDGNFVFGFQTDQDLLDAVEFKDNVDRSNVMQKLQNASINDLFKPRNFVSKTNKISGDNSRKLQSSTSQRLYNPVLCIKEGDTIFFNVESESQQYPRYFKDSILNTNQDFDYGAFKKLEDMILVQNITVQTFSYIFREKGIYVFENSLSGTVTVIGVVSESQTCANTINGIGAAMITEESLAEVGIKVAEKQLVPNWWFIILSFVFINGFVYASIGLIIYAQNQKMRASGLLSTKDNSMNTIYYDKLSRLRMEDTAPRFACFAKCCKKKEEVQKNQVEDQPEEEQDEDKKHEFAISYKEMEQLLNDFNEAQGILKRQLKDREKRQKQMDQEDQGVDYVEGADPEIDLSNLIKELNSLALFVKDNKMCVDKILEDDFEKAAGVVQNQNQDGSTDQETKASEGGPSEKNGANSMRNAMQESIKQMIAKQLEREDSMSRAAIEDANKAQAKHFSGEIEKNEELKQKLLDDFKGRLNKNNLSAEEQEGMLAELNAKMSSVAQAINSEEEQQNKALQEMLNRRRQKKERLAGVITDIADKKNREDDHYQKKLNEIERDAQKAEENIEAEIKNIRSDALDDLHEQKMLKRQRALEKYEDRLKKGDANEDVAAKFLTEYGEKVKQVDADLNQWEREEKEALEEKLKKRREMRKREISEQKENQEGNLNKATVNQRSKLNDEMNQVQNLIKPIHNEEERLQRVAGDLIEAVTHVDTEPKEEESNNNLDIELSPQMQAAQAELDSANDKKAVNSMLRDIDKENTDKKLMIAKQREQLKLQISRCTDDDQKSKLVEQAEKYEKNMTEQLRIDADNQNARLQAALEARRNRRKNVSDRIADEKQAKILNDLRNNMGSKVAKLVDEDRTREIANRIGGGFEKDERVQVGENLLDKKNKQEVIDLMNQLFNERAAALRKYVFELMKQKQRDLADLKGEYDPMREVLRQRKANGLVSEEDFLQQLEKLNQEEHEKKMDLEIVFADKEQEINEEIEKIRVEQETEQKKLLKERQTQEKYFLFNEMMKQMDKGDQMRQYLAVQLDDAEKELEIFTRKANKERDRRQLEMEQQKEQQMEELMERQSRMFNWEDQVKKDEKSFMDTFRKQKEEMMAKKLAEQQKEILRDMNKADVDQMLEKHKRQLLQMDEAIQREQERQMSLMRSKMSGKNEELAREKVTRAIKLAQIQKKKAEDLQKAKEMALEQADLSQVIEPVKNTKLDICIQKASILQKVAYKACYSRPVQFKRHLINQKKLNDFLGLNLFHSQSDLDASSANETVLNSEDRESFMQQLSNGTITYKMLLEHIKVANINYETMRKQQQGEKEVGSVRDTASQMSHFRPKHKFLQN